MATHRFVDVHSYGTNQDAVNKAVSELQAGGGGTLYFALDDYHLERKLELGPIPVWIKGGHPNTRLIWKSPDGGIQYQGAENRPMLKISDLQICTESLPGDSDIHTGIRGDWGQSTKGKEPACIIENVQVRSVDGPEELCPDTSYHCPPEPPEVCPGTNPNCPPGPADCGESRYRYSWATGIHLSNVCNVTMNNVTVKGGHPRHKAPYEGTRGILIDGTRDGTNGFFMSNMFVSDWYEGITLRSHAEGPYLSNFEITGVVKGIYLDHISTATITNGHIDCFRRAAVIRGCHGVHWSNTYLKAIDNPFCYKIDPADPETHNMRFLQIEDSQSVAIIGNEFQMIGSGGPTGEAMAIEVWQQPSTTQLAKVVIMGNTCWGFHNKAFWLNPNVRGCKIVGNTCEDSDNPPLYIAQPQDNQEGFNVKHG